MGLSETQEMVIEGWFTFDRKALLGSRCNSCSTYYFPKELSNCRNPECESELFEEVQLSRFGKLWSFTNSSYPPPKPYVSKEPFEPFVIVAVELEKEKMVVLGQCENKITDLGVGDSMQVVAGVLYERDGVEIITWKFQKVVND